MHLMNTYTILFGIVVILGNASFYLKRDKAINKIITQAIIAVVFISYATATYLSVTHLFNDGFKDTIIDYVSILFPLIFLCVISLFFLLSKVRKFKIEHDKIESSDNPQNYSEKEKKISNNMRVYSLLTAFTMFMKCFLKSLNFFAVGESLDEIEENFENYQLHELSEIKKDHKPLYVYTALSDKDLKAYTELLIKIKNQEITTKEPISFYKYETAETDNFWWDFDNHTMFSYDEKFMKNIHKYVDYLIRYRQGTFKPPV